MVLVCVNIINNIHQTIFLHFSNQFFFYLREGGIALCCNLQESTFIMYCLINAVQIIKIPVYILLKTQCCINFPMNFNKSTCVYFCKWKL